MKNKILFLLHTPPPIHGSSLVGLSIKESEIINNTFKTDYVNLLASKSVSDSGNISIKKIFFFLDTLIRVFSLIVKLKPDLGYLALSTTGPAFFKDFLFVFLLKLFKVKPIYHLHNKGVSLHHNNFLYRICYKYIFKNSDVIILSKLLYSDINSFVHSSNIHICANGIPFLNKNLIVNKCSKLDKVSNSDEPILILFLSNLFVSKGVYILLESCRLLKQKNIRYKCIFVGGEGDINSNTFNKKINKLQLNDEVSYLGPKYGDDKINLYSETDIFVLPSFSDCFPLVLLEAMKHSLPIISTFEGGIPDILENGITGFLVPKMDPYSLADKLEKLIKNRDLRLQMGEEGHNKYLKEFTLGKFENRLLEIFKFTMNNQ